MNEPKPVASLGSSLLARKGGAKPAMRPQLAGFAGMSSRAAAQNLEDLGWNDMGDEDDAQGNSGEVLQLTPAPHNAEAEAETDDASPRPAVRSMRDELAAKIAGTEPDHLIEKTPRPAPERMADVPERTADVPERKAEKPAAPKPEPLAAPTSARPDEAPARPRRQIAQSARRAAFTLRLDAKRHLKLRLASTVRGRSAQQLVTEALDRFLNDIPEIESLAAQVRRD